MLNANPSLRVSQATASTTVGPMQNVEDDDGEEEAEAEEESSWCCTVPTLHPQSIFRLGWDCLILVLMIYTTIVLPMSLAEFPFMLHGAWLIIEQTVNIFFVIDLFLNLRQHGLIDFFTLNTIGRGLLELASFDYSLVILSLYNLLLKYTHFVFAKHNVYIIKALNVHLDAPKDSQVELTVLVLTVR